MKRVSKYRTSQPLRTVVLPTRWLDATGLHPSLFPGTLIELVTYHAFYHPMRSHPSDHNRQAAEAPRVRRVRQDRRALGSSANLSGVRQDAVL